MDHAPPQPPHDSSRPTIGFPVGTALLLIVVFTLSGVFSCCYHWDKLRHLRGQLSDEDRHSDHHPPSKPHPVYMDDRRYVDGSLPVIMAGDEFPRFIAMPCGRAPPSEGRIAGEDSRMSPKPPHVVIPMG